MFRSPFWRLAIAVLCALLGAILGFSNVASAHMIRVHDDTCPNSGSSNYYYAQAYQCYPNGITGVAGRITVDAPFVDKNDPSAHSLAEIAIISETPDRMIAAAIEVGWIVSPSMFNGSMKPHLFVFLSRNGQDPGCWDACGFVPVADPPYQVGAEIQPTDTPLQFAILYQSSNDRWWVRVGNGFVGYFPGNLWNGQFRSGNKAEWYGEVESTMTLPCTQMGNGRTVPDPLSATMTEIGVVTTSSPFQYADPQYLISSSMYYDLGTLSSGHGFYFGGPGATC